MKETLSNHDEAALRKEVRRLRQKQLALTCELIAIPTANPYCGDTTAATEAAGQRWMEARLRERGAAVERISVPPDVYTRGGILGPRERCWKGRENVIGRWVFGDGRGPVIIVNDHMDTVGGGSWQESPFEPRIEGDLLHGLGASDTKGNMVLGLIAVEALLHVADRLRGRIVFESVVDEECDGAGAGTLACCLAGLSGDMALVLDGSGGLPYNGTNGVLTPHLRVHGASGHTGRGGAARALDLAIEVKKAFDVFAARHHAQYPRCHAAIGVFQAGSHASIAPAHVDMTGNIFYPPEEAEASCRRHGRCDGSVLRERFEAAMGDLAATWPAGGEARIDIEWIKDVYPYAMDTGHPLCRQACAAVESVSGRRVECAPMGAWCDATHLSRQLNIPTVGLGFGTPGSAHSHREAARIPDLFSGAETIALLLYRLLRDGGDRQPSGVEA